MSTEKNQASPTEAAPAPEAFTPVLLRQDKALIQRNLRHHNSLLPYLNGVLKEWTVLGEDYDPAVLDHFLSGASPEAYLKEQTLKKSGAVVSDIPGIRKRALDMVQVPSTAALRQAVEALRGAITPTFSPDPPKPRHLEYFEVKDGAFALTQQAQDAIAREHSTYTSTPQENQIVEKARQALQLIEEIKGLGGDFWAGATPGAKLASDTTGFNALELLRIGERHRTSQRHSR